MAFTANAGVENMTLSGADNGALWFQNAVNSWAYRVECTVWLGHGCIQVNGSLRVQLEQFYVTMARGLSPAAAATPSACAVVLPRF